MSDDLKGVLLVMAGILFGGLLSGLIMQTMLNIWPVRNELTAGMIGIFFGLLGAGVGGFAAIYLLSKQK